MAEGRPQKRRRTVDESASDEFAAICLPTSTTESPYHDLENVDSFLSPVTIWGIDEFAHDPDYLASQEELRELLFTTARSTAPTRAATPVEDDETNGDTSSNFSIKQILAKGRRVQYLKNYISAVARMYLSESRSNSSH